MRQTKMYTVESGSTALQRTNEHRLAVKKRDEKFTYLNIGEGQQDTGIILKQLMF